MENNKNTFRWDL